MMQARRSLRNNASHRKTTGVPRRPRSERPDVSRSVRGTARERPPDRLPELLLSKGPRGIRFLAENSAESCPRPGELNSGAAPCGKRRRLKARSSVDEPNGAQAPASPCCPPTPYALRLRAGGCRVEARAAARHPVGSNDDPARRGLRTNL